MSALNPLFLDPDISFQILNHLDTKTIFGFITINTAIYSHSNDTLKKLFFARHPHFQPFPTIYKTLRKYHPDCCWKIAILRIETIPSIHFHRAIKLMCTGLEPEVLEAEKTQLTQLNALQSVTLGRKDKEWMERDTKINSINGQLQILGSSSEELEKFCNESVSNYDRLKLNISRCFPISPHIKDNFPMIRFLANEYEGKLTTEHKMAIDFEAALTHLSLLKPCLEIVKKYTCNSGTSEFSPLDKRNIIELIDQTQVSIVWRGNLWATLHAKIQCTVFHGHDAEEQDCAKENFSRFMPELQSLIEPSVKKCETAITTFTKEFSPPAKVN